MYGILGEHRSDAETVKVLVRRLARNQDLSIKIKGYEGCGELRKKGARQLQAFAALGCSKFIVCHDADGPDPARSRSAVEREITGPAGVTPFCIVIPVHEIEAWILADIQAVTRVFTGWRPEPIANPEGIAKPKEHLERLSAEGLSRPRYAHATHNPRVAAYLDVDLVLSVCPSFVPLAAFVR